MTAGTGGVGQAGSNFSRVDSIVCQITDAELFDEAKFMEALKESVLRDLSEYKATVIGNNNPDPKGFYLEYGLRDVTGAVKVTAMRGPERFYTLQANLTEKSRDSK